jgi:hypothetical protein
VLALLAVTWTVALGIARADVIVLQNGERIEGTIVDATRNTVFIRRAIGGMHQMPIHDIAEVRVELAQGGEIAGALLGWSDGVQEVRSGGEVVRLRAGRVLTRERADESSQPRRTVPPATLAPPENVQKAETPATGAPDATPAAVDGRDGAKRTHAQTTATPEDRPVASAPPVATPVRTTAAPAAIAPAVAGGRDDTVAESAAAKASAGTIPARPRVARIAPSLAAVSEAAAAEIETAALDPAAMVPAGRAPRAIDATHAEAATLAPTVAEAAAKDAAATGAAAVTEIAATPQAPSDGGRLAVRAAIAAAETSAAAIVFRIELSRPAEQTVVLIYGTVDGTAVGGEDYEPKQGVVTLAPGTRSADVHVPVLQHRRARDARFELFLAADPKVAEVVDQRISATIPAAH